MKFRATISLLLACLLFPASATIFAADPTAQELFQQGVDCLSPDNGKPDAARAFSCFKRAAELGDAKAQSNVGAMLLNGEGVARDEKAGVEWLQKAAAQGAELAQFSYAMALSRGIGVERNPGEAVKWYRKAAEQGNLNSQAHLGDLYYRGEGGVEKDHGEAAKWLALAAKQGHANSQNTLGFMTESGDSVPRDMAKAAELYRAAAEQGHARAQSNLGRLYLTGKGVEQDYAISFQWLSLSRSQGEVTAEKLMEQLDLVISDSQRTEGQQLVREYRKALLESRRTKSQNTAAQAMPTP